MLERKFITCFPLPGLVLTRVCSVGVGSSVADTIRTKIVTIDAFADNAPLLMLGMCCAVVASSIYLTICTKIGLPVSTTHSILGGVLGMGIALIGSDDIIWWGGDINSGVVQVFLAWVIAPLLAGVAGAIIFLITKYGILLQKDPALKALYTIPFYFFLTTGLLTSMSPQNPDTSVSVTNKIQCLLSGRVVAAGLTLKGVR